MNAQSSRLASMVHEARFLHERLGFLGTEAGVCADLTALGEERLDAWRAVLGLPPGEDIRVHVSGDWRWEHVQATLSEADPPPPREEPRWAATVAAMIREVGRQGHRIAAALPEHELPYIDLLQPFVCLALRAVQSRTDNVIRNRLSEQAHADLAFGLLRTLSELAADCLQHEFSLQRQKGREWLGRMLGNSAPNSTDDYRAFVERHRSDGMATFFMRYPVLARLLAVAIDNWTDAACEFLGRLAADWSDLEQAFGCNGQTVTRIECGLSDTHDHGRSVIIAVTDSGWRIVYKPRSLAPEAAWRPFVAMLDPELAAATPRVVDRGAYGWMEYATPRECSDEAAVRRFFTRIGTILCAVYLLGGKDFHCDNLIACGEFPIIVDLETLGQPDLIQGASAEDRVSQSMDARQQLFWSSVMRTEFLPRWRSSGGCTATDESALSGPDDRLRRKIQWRAVNTDFMHKAYEVSPGESSNLPHLKGKVVRAENYSDAILDGFAHAWVTLMERRGELLAESGALEGFRHMPCRFIFRATDVYYGVLRSALAPEALKNGIDFSLKLEALRRAALGGGVCATAARLVDAEIAALERGDIPRFGALTDAMSLSQGVPAPIAGYFKKTGYDSVVERLSRLSLDGLERQMHCLRLLFQGEQARSLRRGAMSFTDNAEGECAAASALSDAEAIAHACRLGEAILRDAVAVGSGLSWIGLTYSDCAQGFKVNPLNDSFYEGNAGIALFLAALHRVTGEQRFSDGSLAALHDFRDFAKTIPGSAGDAAVAKLGLGLGGIGGQLYAVVRIAHLLDDERLLKEAERIAGLMTETAIELDAELDVLGGVGGAIPGLLALHAATKEAWVLERACACGFHLLRADPPKWDDSASGFGHGAFGIAAQLARLGRATGHDAFTQHAKRLFTCDDVVTANPGSARLPMHGPHAGLCRIGWCNGAAGEGLSQLYGNSPNGQPAAAIEAAVAAISSGWAAGTDQVCCGAFAGVEFLTTASQRLGRPDWQAEARRIAASVLDRAGRAGGFHLLPAVPRAYQGPSFFQGVAGIGYSLLRLARQDAIPSALALE